jgi:hypothetical protein
MEADVLPKPRRCKYDMAKSIQPFDCTIGDIRRLVHGLLRQRLPAVGVKKDDLPRELKQKAC